MESIIFEINYIIKRGRINMKYVRLTSGILTRDFNVTPTICIHRYDWRYLDFDITINFLKWYVGINFCNERNWSK